MVKKVHYVYHWNRIFGAFAALLLLIGAVFYGVSSLVDNENLQRADTPSVASNQETGLADHSQPLEETDDPQPAPPDMPDEDPPAVEKPDQPAFEPARVQPDISEESKLPAIEVEHDSPPGTETKQPSIPSEPIETDTARPDTNQTSLPDQPQPIPQKEPEPTAPPKQSEPATADIPQDADSTKAFYLEEINSFSPSVKRFTLARAVKDLEPIGTLDSITMDDEGIAVVYAFSEIADMRDGAFYYYWFYEGKQVAKVRVGIGNDSWRSYSSKYITDKMRGVWSVELHTEDGQKLASAKFNAG